MALPKTIDEVIDRLGLILSDQLQLEERSCLFTYIYLVTTEAIKAGIENEIFEDNPRMEEFDVRFANLFIQAYEGHKAGESIAESWQIAFEQAKEPLTIIQHILLGMNAHINFDLAVAASETCSGLSIFDLENDFQKVNEILFSLTKQSQEKIGRVSPLFFLVDNVVTKADEEIVNFSIEQARDQSWRHAVLLAHADQITTPMLLDEIDKAIYKIGKRIVRPKSFIFRKVLRLISRSEQKNLHTIIRELYQ